MFEEEVEEKRKKKMLQTLPLREEWLAAAKEAIVGSGGGANGQRATPAQVLERFMRTDMKDSCKPSLPERVASMHMQKLEGTYVLQIENWSNLALAGEQREKRKQAEAVSGQKRTLFFHLSDGHQTVCAIELVNLGEFGDRFALPEPPPIGSKVIMTDVEVSRGMLLLGPTSIKYAGGGIPERRSQPIEHAEMDYGGGDNAVVVDDDDDDDDDDALMKMPLPGPQATRCNSSGNESSSLSAAQRSSSATSISSNVGNGKRTVDSDEDFDVCPPPPKSKKRRVKKKFS